MIPDDTIRDEFLRAYLDANYEVTVANGPGVLLAIKVPQNASMDKKFNESLKKPDRSPMKVVGGVVFVPPAEDNCGWAVNNDELYWAAYEKHGLADISAEGLQRVIRYEAWENRNLGEKLTRARIPVWNGLFCAIHPEYSCRGLGGLVYNEAISIIGNMWLEKQAALKTAEDKKASKQITNSITAKIRNRICLNHQQDKSLSNNNHKNTASKRDFYLNPKNNNLSSMLGNSSSPLIIAVSHSERSASFHKKNGFHAVARLPFCDSDENDTSACEPLNPQFYVHVLVLDPFRSGRVPEFNKAVSVP